ncbi:hypothetical protein C1N53_21805 [Pontibacter sp. SGAir0037]|nr:hypothetical protein C1N53_21805 [Pontibacter sp. SGAir0037]
MHIHDQKFLKAWAKTQQKGRTVYILKGIACGFIFAFISEAFNLFESGFTSTYFTYKFLLRACVYITGSAFWWHYTWNQNCKRYNTLTNNPSSA